MAFKLSKFLSLLPALILFILSNLLIVPVQAAPQTITFNDLIVSGWRALNGQYPTNVINWGTNQWVLSAPWGQFTSNSISFTSSRNTSTFTLITPKKLVSLQAFNGGGGSSTITVSCTGNTTKTQSVGAGQLVTITTGWVNNCNSVTISSSNGWDTNFDNLIIDDAVTDTQAPTVSLTVPTDGSTVSGSTVAVSANASDDIGVVGVQFKLDGENLGAEDTTSPYSVNWDTTAASNGAHVLTAVARDAAGNSTTAANVNITVNNPPKLTITAPTENQSISSNSVTVNYTKSGDLTEANHAHFRLDGGSTVMDIDFDGTYTFNNVSPGTHTLVGIIARSDHTEITGSDFTVNFVTTAPDLTPPTVSITAPSDQSTVSGTVNVTASASDDVAISGVQFKLDGADLGTEDTTAPYSVSWNTTTVANGIYTLTVVAKDSSLNQTTSDPVTVTVNNADPRAVSGEWGSLLNWPLVAVHASLMHTGKVLIWDAWEYGTSQAKVWDPATNTFENASVADQLFCSGHSTLADGKILVLGGHNGGEVGIKSANIFNPVTGAWTKAPNMQFDRWYPSSTTLGDGRVVTVSGMVNGNTWADRPEVYNPTTNTWTTLDVNTSDMHDHEYPLSYLLPNGKVFVAAATPAIARILDVNAQTWTPIPNLPIANGSFAMYRPGKLLYTGGGVYNSTSQPNAYTIDINQANPSWTQIPSMANARFNHNLTILPDGTVMAVGGAPTVTQYTAAGTKTTELWNPDTNTWTSLANQQSIRNYHSVSILLPDGRVLSAGGGRLDNIPNQFTAQIFNPPYLFKGARPTITSAPSVIEHADTMTLETPDAASISKVSLIPLASETHTLDMNQRYLELSFTKQSGQLAVSTPSNINEAPPGYYMVFILNGNGVPSVAKIVRLGGDTHAPTVLITDPQDESEVLNTVTISANAADNVGVSSVQFMLDGNNLGSPDTTAPYSISWDTKTAANGNHILTAKAIDTSGNEATSDAVEVVVNNPPDTTAPTISDVNSSNITSSGATITWTTDENADSQIEYGPDTNYGSQTALDSVLGTNHSQTLTGLSLNTQYHYRVKSKDASGNLSTSDDFTFTTLASNPQTITFNDLPVNPNSFVALNGQYPTNVINWGTNQWVLSSPWQQLTTNSFSFTSSRNNSTFTFLSPKRLTKIDAYNGGSANSTITLSCSGNTTKTQVVNINQLVTIETGWTNPCSAVTISSTNGWNTNFDNLIIE